MYSLLSKQGKTLLVAACFSYPVKVATSRSSQKINENENKLILINSSRALCFMVRAGSPSLVIIICIVCLLSVMHVPLELR